MLFSEIETDNCFNTLVQCATYMITKPGRGEGIKAGQKVLIAVDNKRDMLVIEAYYEALKQLGARVDVVVYDKGGPSYEWNAWDEISQDPELPYCWSPPHWVDDMAKNYDWTLSAEMGASGGTEGPGGGRTVPFPSKIRYLGERTREQLLSPAKTFPDEIKNLLDVKTNEMVKRVWKARVTDPEGTDFRFTFFDEYWDKMNGPPYTKTPYMPGHILAFPYYPFPQSDAEGTIAATTNHIGVYPRMELAIEGGKITGIKGGGTYGELWRERLEKMKDVVYPDHLPGPGVGWITGFPIGTHPKVTRPQRSLGLFPLLECSRAGVVHIDFGPHAHVDKREKFLQYAKEGRTLRHIHVQLYFVTYEAETKDGKKFKILDRGHLTTLDDPEVREVAAKYGDPDELLKVEWVPAVPGISIPGNYKDYATDPLLWIKNNLPVSWGSTVVKPH